MLTAAITAALVLAGAALAVALTRDDGTTKRRTCTGSIYPCVSKGYADYSGGYADP